VQGKRHITVSGREKDTTGYLAAGEDTFFKQGKDIGV
jgi:hypothetical protein